MERQFKIIFLILIQLIFNAALISSELLENLFNYTLLGPAIVLPINVIITVTSIYLIVQSMDLITKEQRLKELERQNSYNEELSTAIRTIKHDVANQIMIIDGLYQLGKRNDSIAYSRKMLSKFDWMDNVLKLKKPEIISLIIKKVNEANDYGIETVIEVVEDEDTGQNISMDRLTRIISNLLDNAIFALKANPAGDNILKLRLTSNLGFFEVENSGNLDEKIQSKIFEKGFTTKGNEGNGLGLYIVKTLTEEMNGELDFSVDNDRIRFTVDFKQIS